MPQPGTVKEAVVALVTGEEKIIPAAARYWICTVEAMPLEIGADFVAVDEIQLCADPERGHVFTDRLLHARGLVETMFLGAETIRPLLQRLVPQADGHPAGPPDHAAGAGQPRRADVAGGQRVLVDRVVVQRLLQTAGQLHRLSDLGAGGVVVVGRQGHGGQDTDDRDHDHQFDQSETLLNALHV